MATNARTVLITGASSGIGRSLAVELARRGWHVALSARRADELEKAAEEIRQAGGRALVLPCDVGDTEAATEVVRRADRELGALDMVVANAGVGQYGHASQLTWKDVEPQIRINIAGALATLTAAIPIMIAQQKGHLVGVSSLAGKRGLPRSAAYCAAKAALSTFLESVRIDLAPAGIRVTDVQPGFVATPMTAGAKHARPMEWTSEKAASVIARRLERGPAVIAFPWPLAFMSSLGRVMPTWLYDVITRRAS